MANFSKVLGLASTALVFAGMAFGQNCTGGAPLQAPVIRAEGTTELIGEYQFMCAVGSTINILDIVSLPVTSKSLNSAGATEAIAVVAGGATYNGTVSGSQVTFSNVVVPAGATVTIANIRVNASTVTVGTGAPPAVTESAFISGVGVQASVTTSASVAFVLAGLGSQTAYKAVAVPASGGPPPGTAVTAAALGSAGLVRSANLVCATYNTTANGTSPLIAAINFKENFPTAFKAAGTVAGNGALGSEFTNNTETGVGVTLGAATNAATTATMIQVAFANIPSGVTVYVPTVLTDINGSGGTFTLVTSPSNTAAVAAAPASANAVAGTAALSASSGSATAYYLFAPGAGSNPNNNLPSNAVNDSFSLPVYANSAANTVAATATAMTAAVSFAPIGSTQIPNFVVGSSTSTITLNTFAACSTSLLFPFVTNQLGFDTGIAISNTSTDPFGTKGATAQAGTCTLNFYGSGAPSPATYVTPAPVTSGTSWTTVVSSVAAGFQGYIIAQCNFQYAHGFAFITYGLGTSSGIAEGYLAGVIPDVNQLNRNAGVGEVLGN